GFSPKYVLYGVLLSLFARVGILFFKYVAVFATSAHNSFGIPAECIIDLTHSIRVRLYLSATPFCSGLYGTVVSCRMPCLSKYFRMSSLMYSPPPSERRIFIGLPICFSTYVRNSTNFSNASLLLCRKYNFAYRLV